MTGWVKRRSSQREPIRSRSAAGRRRRFQAINDRSAAKRAIRCSARCRPVRSCARPIDTSHARWEIEFACSSRTPTRMIATDRDGRPRPDHRVRRTPVVTVSMGRASTGDFLSASNQRYCCNQRNSDPRCEVARQGSIRNVRRRMRTWSTVAASSKVSTAGDDDSHSRCTTNLHRPPIRAIVASRLSSTGTIHHGLVAPD